MKLKDICLEELSNLTGSVKKLFEMSGILKLIPVTE